jgi:hypothetical protein
MRMCWTPVAAFGRQWRASIGCLPSAATPVKGMHRQARCRSELIGPRHLRPGSPVLVTGASTGTGRATAADQMLPGAAR